jgi:hypothetical protein
MPPSAQTPGASTGDAAYGETADAVMGQPQSSTSRLTMKSPVRTAVAAPPILASCWADDGALANAPWPTPICFDTMLTDVDCDQQQRIRYFTF